jgi:hypothetical protein
MQRISLLLAGFAPAALFGQQTAGTELWRLAATTLPLPPALGTGGAAAFWNPAQPAMPEQVSLALEVIQTASTVGASGVLASVRVRVRPLGQVGLVYGRMGIGDLVRTSLSPDPDPGAIPYYTQTLGATWGMALGGGGTALGATLAYQDTRLDATQSNRWTLDVGARRSFSDAVTLAAATHFFSRFTTRDAAQELYGGLEVRVWRGPVWGSRGAVRGRYGIATAHGFSADHQFGAGFELGSQFGCDLVVVREGSYGQVGWRAVTGVRVGVGRYRVSFARDFGVNDVGAAYRVGLEGRMP